MDLLHADVDHLVDADPARILPPGSGLLRFGWASALVTLHPELLEPWATSPDTAVRRAVMRSPDLTPEVAVAVVAARRSGMHTLGSNPQTPPELLARNPGAQRRFDRVRAAAPDGVRSRLDDPNRPELVSVGSPTLDLVIALAPDLSDEQADRMARRAEPAADAWVLALLVAGGDETVLDAVSTHASRSRLHAVDELGPAASRCRTRASTGV